MRNDTFRIWELRDGEHRSRFCGADEFNKLIATRKVYEESNALRTISPLLGSQRDAFPCYLRCPSSHSQSAKSSYNRNSDQLPCGTSRIYGPSWNRLHRGIYASQSKPSAASTSWMFIDAYVYHCGTPFYLSGRRESPCQGSVHFVSLDSSSFRCWLILNHVHAAKTARTSTVSGAVRVKYM